MTDIQKLFGTKLDESSLSRLWQKHQNHDGGIITAYRGTNTKSKNQSLNSVLSNALIGKGYSLTTVTGHFLEDEGLPTERWVKERSFVVIDHNDTGKLKKDLVNLGTKFDQDCITFWSVKENKYYAICTTHRKWKDKKDHYGQVDYIGTPKFGTSSDWCYSKIGSRPFKISESVGTEIDCKLSDFNRMSRFVFNKYRKMLFESDMTADAIYKKYKEDTKSVDDIVTNCKSPMKETEMKKLFGSKVDLTESSLSRLWQKHQEYDAGTISAYRSERTNAENRKLSGELRNILIGVGYSVTEIDGVYTENYGTKDAVDVKERAFIVFDHKNKKNLKQNLMKLGAKYGQDSITYWDVKEKTYYLIGTRQGGYPGLGRAERLGKPMFGQSGEFHSKISGRPFVFKESEDAVSIGTYDTVVEDFSLMSRAYCAMNARKILESIEEIDETSEEDIKKISNVCSGIVGQKPTKFKDLTVNSAIVYTMELKGVTVAIMTNKSDKQINKITFEWDKQPDKKFVKDMEGEMFRLGMKLSRNNDNKTVFIPTKPVVIKV